MDKYYITIHNVSVVSNILQYIYKFCSKSTLKILSMTNSFFRKTVFNIYEYIRDTPIDILIFISDDILLFKYIERNKNGTNGIDRYININNIKNTMKNKYKMEKLGFSGEKIIIMDINQKDVMILISSISSILSSYEIIKYIHINYNLLDDNICINAAINGNIKCLEYGYKNGCNWNTYICYGAIEFDKYECLVYAIENGCPCDNDICNDAVKFSDLKYLYYLISKGFKYNYYTLIIAIDNKNNNAIKYLHENHDLIDKYRDFSVNLYESAINTNNIEYIKYLYEHNYIWNESTWINAINSSNIEILDYLYDNNCPYKFEKICKYTAKNGNLNILKYLHEKGFPLNIKVAQKAAKHGHYDILVYLHENKCPWDGMICAYSLYKRHYECFKYAYDNGCQINKYCYEAIAQNGNLELFKYLHNNEIQLRRYECIWDEDTCSDAAWYQNFDILKYAHENGCPWDEVTGIYIVHYNNLEMLKYLHINKCPLNEKVFERAAQQGSLECLIFLHVNGYKWDIRTTNAAHYHKQSKCLKYAIDNDCPYYI